MFIVTSTSITYDERNVVAGESLNLTCTANITGRGTPSFTWTGNITGRGTPSFTWTGQVRRSPQLGQPVQGSMNVFTDSFIIDRVSQIISTVQCETSIGNSTLNASVTLSASGKCTYIVVNIIIIKIMRYIYIYSSPSFSQHKRE